MIVRSLLLLAVVIALPAMAQTPSAGAVLDAWAADWRRSAEGLAGVEMEEELVRHLEGPRRPIEVVGVGLVSYRPRTRPERIPRRVTVNGRLVDPDQFSMQGRRIDRAFGPGGREIAAPPPLASFLLRDADAFDLRPDQIGGRAAWRVSLRLSRGDDAVAWFTPSRTSPRLLRLRTEGRRPDGATLVRDMSFTRVEGLDLPSETRVELTVRQRRRLRAYVVTLTAVGRYTDHRLLY